MNSFIDREFQQIQPIFPWSRTGDVFGRMFVISLVMHVIFAAFLFSTHQNRLKGPPVNYLELKDCKFHEQSDSSSPQESKTAEAIPDEPREAELPPTQAHSESEKLLQDVKQSLASAGTNPASLHERSFGLGLTTGYFSSLAEGETLRNDIRDYYFSMLREINEKWWLNNEEHSGGLGGAIVQIVVARNGMIVDKTFIRSSGNPSFDRSILQALEKASPLPPLPPDYQLNYFSAPLRFNAPLNLFSS